MRPNAQTKWTRSPWSVGDNDPPQRPHTTRAPVTRTLDHGRSEIARERDRSRSTTHVRFRVPHGFVSDSVRGQDRAHGRQSSRWLRPRYQVWP